MANRLTIDGGAGEGPRKTLQGTTRVPGDKSISHRAVMFASVAHGQSVIRGFLHGHDCLATVSIMRSLGVSIELTSPTELVISGVGLDGLEKPAGPLDAQNSGTTMRLMAGLLSGQDFPSELVGTPQLQGRPMKRIIDPLAMMGAQISSFRDRGFAPLAIKSAPMGLRSISYEMPVASAQVKSAVLLAGLYADGLTEAIEPGPCRDHTERLLSAMGAGVDTTGTRVSISRPKGPLRTLEMTVPGDPSSAAFLVAAGTLVAGSHIRLEGVGVNPTRTGFFDAIAAMGARVEREGLREEAGEPVSDLDVFGSSLEARTFGGDAIVTMIDELPLLALVATQAQGTTIISDAGELRVKETDRIDATASELRKLGADVTTADDGFVIRGPTALRGTQVESHGDHRLAMMLTVAGLISEGRTVVDGAEVTDDSFPGFVSTLCSLGASIEEEDL